MGSLRSPRLLALLVTLAAAAFTGLAACAPKPAATVSAAIPASALRPRAAPDAPPRLTPGRCAQRDDGLELRIARMREEVDDELRTWREDQPACWAEDREREARRVADEACILHNDCSHRGPVFFAPAPEPAASFSTTNDQVAGVDEADLVKTDGRYVYIVAHGALRIVPALHPRVLSVTRLSGQARNLLIEGDRAVVFTASGPGKAACTYAYDCAVERDFTSTQVHVIDVTDRSAPVERRRIDLSGSFLAARRIGHTVHAVVADGDSAPGHYDHWPDGLARCGVKESVVRARIAQLKTDNERRLRASVTLPTSTERGATRSLCTNVLEAKDDRTPAFTSVVSFDLTDDRAAATTATVRTHAGLVYAADDALYLSGTHPADDGIDVTDIHKLHLGARPADTRYVGSGTVPGRVLDPRSFDQWQGSLRVATTRGHIASRDAESAVSILAEGEGGALVRVGAIEHLAPGEDIRAVRFDDDRGYVVTFRQTDPLLVLDLHDGAHPAVLGELHLPGFSTYLHRLDPTHLLSVGFDSADDRSFDDADGLLLQIFDVADLRAPRLVRREVIGGRGTSSQATADPLAFDYLAERGLLGLPVTLCEHGRDRAPSFDGLAVYRVDAHDGLAPLGRVDQGPRSAARCSDRWTTASSVVARSLFVDDLVYAVASDQVKVQRLGALGRDVAVLSLRP